MLEVNLIAVFDTISEVCFKIKPD